MISDRKAYIQKYKENYKQIKKNSTIKDKLLYNTGTRKRAAKLMTKKNMSEKDAVSKAKKEAWRNTAIIAGGALAAIGGKKLIESQYLKKRGKELLKKAGKVKGYVKVPDASFKNKVKYLRGYRLIDFKK